MRRGRLLLMAQRPGKPLGPPPARLTESQLQAWNDIVASCHDVLRVHDFLIVELCATLLASWRAGLLNPDCARELYRFLGKLLMPMKNRRALMFPERA